MEQAFQLLGVAAVTTGSESIAGIVFVVPAPFYSKIVTAGAQLSYIYPA